MYPIVSTAYLCRVGFRGNFYLPPHIFYTSSKYLQEMWSILMSNENIYLFSFENQKQHKAKPLFLEGHLSPREGAGIHSGRRCYCEGRLGGSVGWVADSLKWLRPWSQSGSWDWAWCWTLWSAWSLLEILSLSPCHPTHVLPLSRINKQTNKQTPLEGVLVVHSTRRPWVLPCFS